LCKQLQAEKSRKAANKKAQPQILKSTHRQMGEKAKRSEKPNKTRIEAS